MRGSLLRVGVADGVLEIDRDLHERYSLLYLAERFVHLSKVPAPVGLAPTVAELAGDGELLLKELDGTLRLPQIRVGGPQAAEVSALSTMTVKASSGGQRRLEPADAIPGVVAQREVVPAGVRIIAAQATSRLVRR